LFINKGSLFTFAELIIKPIKQMKKTVFLSLALVAMMVMSCGQGAEEVTEAEVTVDSTVVEEVAVDVVVEEATVDSVVAE